MDNIFYGRYPYGKNGETQPLEWQVLERDVNGTLLITKDVIECLPINNKEGKWAWETCSLRSWLCDCFFTKAFTEDERARIEKIFLLDNQQVYKYFPRMEDRLAKPTPYAIQQGVLEYDGNKKSMWWVSSYGIGQLKTHASFVSYDGFLFEVGRRATATKYGVRVTIYLKD